MKFKDYMIGTRKELGDCIDEEVKSDKDWTKTLIKVCGYEALELAATFGFYYGSQKLGFDPSIAIAGTALIASDVAQRAINSYVGLYNFSKKGKPEKLSSLEKQKKILKIAAPPSWIGLLRK